MKDTDNGLVSAELRKTLKKLISEEYYAYQLYMLSRMAVKSEWHAAIDDLFSEIAEDELGDHMKQLIAWCREYGVDIPCSESEFRKAAGEKASKQVSALKKNKDAAYYIAEAIKTEELAADSYKEAIETDGVSQLTDLQSLLWHIYYDEAEHLGKLRTARIAVDTGDSLTFGF